MVEQGKPRSIPTKAKKSPFVEVGVDEIGQASGVVFARESPLAPKSDQGCSVSHSHGDDETQESDGCVQSQGLDEHGWVDFGHSLQLVLFSRQWSLAESLVDLADQQPMLDYGLSIALDAIWFLRTKQDLEGLNSLISKIVASGAKDFARAILRTSLLASCVAACQSKAITVGNSKEIVAER